MARIVVNAGPIEAWDYANQLPKKQWKALISRRRLHCKTRLHADCRDLLRFKQEAEELGMWKELGYADIDDFIRRGLDLDPILVGWALDGLRVMKPDEAAPFEKAIETGRSLQKEGAPVGNQNARKEKNNSSVTRVVSLGKKIDAGYFHAKLAQGGRIDLLEKIERGEISTHAAAIEAGLRTRMIQHPPTVAGFARAIHKHLGEEQRAELRKELDK